MGQSDRARQASRRAASSRPAVRSRPRLELLEDPHTVERREFQFRRQLRLSVTNSSSNGGGRLERRRQARPGSGQQRSTASACCWATATALSRPLNTRRRRPSYCVVVADFNGDGKPDLAVANDSNTQHRQRPARQRRRHLPGRPATYAVGHGPDAVAVGDFNGDGKPDLAVANDGSSVTSACCWATATAPSRPPNFAVGGHAHSVAVGDFNGDGKLDLAVANRRQHRQRAAGQRRRHLPGAQQLRRRRAVPSPWRWATSTATASSTWPCANSSSGNVSVLLGNGDGTFQAAQTSTSGVPVPHRWPSATSTATASSTWLVANYRQQQRERAAGQRRRHLPGRRRTSPPAPDPAPWRWATSTATASPTWQWPTNTNNTVSVLLNQLVTTTAMSGPASSIYAQPSPTVPPS